MRPQVVCGRQGFGCTTQLCRGEGSIRRKSMYDVCAMRRTNIYLDDEQLASLRGLSERRGESVATLVRQAIDEWLSAQGVRRIPEDEWRRRFSALLERRARVADQEGFSEADVERDVMDAVREVRRARAARRR
jgi:hypothetical protein